MYIHNLDSLASWIDLTFSRLLFLPCRHVLPAVPQRAQLVQHALQPLRQRQPRLRAADAGQAAPAATVRQGELPGENYPLKDSNQPRATPVKKILIISQLPSVSIDSALNVWVDFLSALCCCFTQPLALHYAHIVSKAISFLYSNNPRTPKSTHLFIESSTLQSVRFPAGGQQQFVTRPAPPGTPAASSGSGQTPAQTFPFAPTEASQAVRFFDYPLELNCRLFAFSNLLIALSGAVGSQQRGHSVPTVLAEVPAAAGTECGDETQQLIF